MDKKFFTKKELLEHSNKLIANSKYANSIFGTSLHSLFDAYISHFPNLNKEDIKELRHKGVQYLNTLSFNKNYVKFIDFMVVYAAIKSLDSSLKKLKDIEKKAFEFYKSLTNNFPSNETQDMWAEDLSMTAATIASSINNEFYDVSFIHDSITEYMFMYTLLYLFSYYRNNCQLTTKEKQELLTAYINNERQSI